jgi:hypothetical protein
MTSSLLRRRLCIMTILAASLLFLPLTGTVNNTASASAGIPSYRGDPEYDRWTYKIYLDSYISCVNVIQDYIDFFGEPPPNDLDCGTLPEPPPPLQPLDCNELQSCPPPSCDPNFASCPQQPLPFRPSTRPLTPEEACQQFGCINPVPPGTPTPAEQREEIRKFFEDWDSQRRNPLWGPATEACRLGGLSDPERCGRITNPQWDALDGAFGPPIEGSFGNPQTPSLKPPMIPFPFH